MILRLLAVAVVLAPLVNACALDVGAPEDEDVGQVSLEAKGAPKPCVWDGDCAPHQYCLVDPSSCVTDPSCPPGEACICYGACARDLCGGCGKGKSCVECKTVDGSDWVCMPDGAMC
jgi:hypothetical protein